jgi:hypothetical protein
MWTLSHYPTNEGSSFIRFCYINIGVSTDIFLPAFVFIMCLSYIELKHDYQRKARSLAWLCTLLFTA